ncbi:MAG: phage tail tube protein [Rhizobiaceae bacterium]
MARYYRKLAVLAKRETAYATDPVPTGGANAMLMTDVSITPIAGGAEERNLLTPAFGHQGNIPVATHVIFEGSVEAASSGAKGTAPAWGVLLRMCGMAETVTAATKVAYTPVSSAQDSGTIYFNADGVNHKLTGARGGFQVEFAAQRIPRFRFRFLGLYNGPTDTAVPAVTLTGFKTPLPVNKTNSTLSLHGVAAIAESLSLDFGNTVEPRLLIGSDTVEITDRKVTGRAVIEATALSVKNWFSTHLASTRGTLDFGHGAADGAIVEIDAPAVEIGAPEQGQTQGILNAALPLMFVPSAGDDEVVITVR